MLNKDVSIRYVTTLDASGLRCPEPMMLLHREIRHLQEGECLKFIGTEQSLTRDVTKFCSFLGHSLLADESKEDRLQFIIKKGAS